MPQMPITVTVNHQQEIIINLWLVNFLNYYLLIFIENCQTTCAKLGFIEGFEKCKNVNPNPNPQPTPNPEPNPQPEPEPQPNPQPTPSGNCVDKTDLANCKHYAQVGDCDPKATYYGWMIGKNPKNLNILSYLK